MLTKSRKLTSVVVLFSICMLASGMSQKANARIPDDESPSSRSVQTSTLTSALPAKFRAMTPAESVGADLVKRYRTESGFNGVFVDGPTLVRLAMKGGKVDTPQPTDGVTIVVESTTFSFEELLVAARRLDKQNPKSYGTTIESDKGRLVMNLAPTAPLRVDGSILVDKTLVDPLIDVVATILLSPPKLDAAEGGRLSDGNGCTTGFRYNGSLISSASHCSNNFGYVNGVAITWQADYCDIDNQTGTSYGNDTGTAVQGMPFWGGQGDVGYGTQVYKWGTATLWSYPTMGYLSTSTISCDVLVYLLDGGSSVGGDSGGPIMTLVWNGTGYSYNAVGTHRGSIGASLMIVPISRINSSGLYVG